MRTVILTALAVAAILFGSAEWIRADAESQMRQSTVENWNAINGESADFYFSASGGTLKVFPVDVEEYRGPLGDSLACYFAHERTKELQDVGFRRVCVSDRCEAIR